MQPAVPSMNDPNNKNINSKNNIKNQLTMLYDTKQHF